VAGEAFQSNLTNQTEMVALQTQAIREEIAAERAEIARDRTEYIKLVRVARDTYQKEKRVSNLDLTALSPSEVRSHLSGTDNYLEMLML
jgi:hypothetical protein